MEIIKLFSTTLLTLTKLFKLIAVIPSSLKLNNSRGLLTSLPDAGRSLQLRP